MKRAKLDRSRSYAESHGRNAGPPFWQDGKPFDGQGIEIKAGDNNATKPTTVNDAPVVQNAAERQAIINKAFQDESEEAPDQEKDNPGESTRPEPGPDTAPENTDVGPDPVAVVLATNPKSYKTRELIMEALDILKADYNNRERKTVLRDRLKTAIEKRKSD